MARPNQSVRDLLNTANEKLADLISQGKAPVSGGLPTGMDPAKDMLRNLFKSLTSKGDPTAAQSQPVPLPSPVQRSLLNVTHVFDDLAKKVVGMDLAKKMEGGNPWFWQRFPAPGDVERNMGNLFNKGTPEEGGRKKTSLTDLMGGLNLPPPPLPGAGKSSASLRDLFHNAGDIPIGGAAQGLFDLFHPPTPPPAAPEKFDALAEARKRLASGAQAKQIQEAMERLRPLPNIRAGLSRIAMGNIERPEQAGAGLSQAVGAALGAIPGPAGKVGVVLGSLGASLFNTIGAVRTWTDHLHQSNMQFADFSPSMGLVAAQQQMRDFFYNFQRGEARSASADRAMREFSATREEFAPLSDEIANQFNEKEGDFWLGLRMLKNHPVASTMRLLAGKAGQEMYEEAARGEALDEALKRRQGKKKDVFDPDQTLGEAGKTWSETWGKPGWAK